MHYICKNCSQTIDTEKILSFCPFCASAYDTAQGKQPAPIHTAAHIVVEADSRRTVQERYWQLSRQALKEKLTDLTYEIPRFLPPAKTNEPEENDSDIEPQKLDETEWTVLGNCTSFSGFRKRLDQLLETMQNEFNQRMVDLVQIQKAVTSGRTEEILRLMRALLHDQGAAVEGERIIDLCREERFIHVFCSRAAIALGCPSPKDLQPVLDYTPEESLCDMPWVDTTDIPSPEDDRAYRELLLTLQQSRPTLLHALEENSLIALSAIKHKQEAAPEPTQCIQRLRMLAARDYDAIFGDSPDPLIETYSESVQSVIHFISTLPAGAAWRCLIDDKSLRQILKRQRERIEEYKQDYLERLIDQWESVLTVQLDRLYQQQRTDMIEVYEKLQHEIGKTESPDQ